MVTEARKKANRNWDEKNKDRKAYLSWRSRARSFIIKAATEDDLEDLKNLINERLDIKIKE